VANAVSSLVLIRLAGVCRFQGPVRSITPGAALHPQAVLIPGALAVASVVPRVSVLSARRLAQKREGLTNLSVPDGNAPVD